MQEELKQQLLEMNKYDIRLFEFAQSLMAYRLKLISPLVTDVNNYIANGDSENYNKRVSQQCVLHNRPEILRTYKNDIGVFQPPGHKAPL